MWIIFTGGLHYIHISSIYSFEMETLQNIFEDIFPVGYVGSFAALNCLHQSSRDFLHKLQAEVSVLHMDHGCYLIIITIYI
jgi:hypothetical protein